MDDADFMRRCLQLGRIALNSGDAPVGSVIVVSGQIIAEAVEAVKQNTDPTAHAELLAVRVACQKLQTLELPGATLYTNVEPCVMCALAIRQAKISRVVFGIRNHQIGAVTSKFNVLTATDFPAKFALPIIDIGILQIECENLMFEFLKFKQSQK